LIHNHDKITTFNNVNIDNIDRVRNVDLSEKIYSENSEKIIKKYPKI